MHRTTVFLLTAAALGLAALALRPSAAPRSTGGLGPSPARPWHAPPSRASSAHPALVTTTSLSHTHLEPGGLAYAEVHVRAAANGQVERSPVSVALVLDVSGSMQGTKLAVAKLAARRFVEALGDEDTVALVPFSDRATLVGPWRVDEAARARLLSAIDTLRADGATNISHGLEQAEAALVQVDGSRRVVVISDGQPTAGHTTREGLSRVTSAMHGRGLSVTFLGVGEGFDASLLLALSEVGGGMYGSLTNVEALPEVLGKELAQARGTLARNVSLVLDGLGGAKVEHVIGFPTTTLGSQLEVQLPDFALGTEVTVFAAIRLDPDVSPSPRVSAEARWVEPGSGRLVSGEAFVTSALVVADAAEAQRTRDEVRFARALKAAGGEQLLQASAALERGDSASALGIFDNVRALFGASADALAGETAVIAQEAAALRADPSSAGLRGKSLQKKSLESFSERNVY